MTTSPSLFRTVRGHLERFASDSRASPAVEFALIAPVFVALLLASLQAGVIFLAKAYLESVAETGARTVLSGQAGSMTQAQFQTAICAEVSALFNCGQLIVQLEPLPSTATSLSTFIPQFNPDGTLTSPTAFAPGAGGQNMVLIVAYQWPVYGGPLGLNFSTLGNGTLLMMSTQVFRIEA